MLLFFRMWFSKKSVEFEIWEVVISFVRYLIFSQFFEVFIDWFFLLANLKRSWWTEERKRVFFSDFCLIRGNRLERYSYYLKIEAMFWLKEPTKKVFFFCYQNPIFCFWIVSYLWPRKKGNAIHGNSFCQSLKKGSSTIPSESGSKKNCAKASKF